MIFLKIHALWSLKFMTYKMVVFLLLKDFSSELYSKMTLKSRDVVYSLFPLEKGVLKNIFVACFNTI